jgi:hypothetical protein
MATSPACSATATPSTPGNSRCSPRPASEDGTRQGQPVRIRYLPAAPADKSVLELDDADYTWQLNAEQCAELEAFIANFDPANAIAATTAAAR